ncbi:alpha/beta hydrolase [Pseudomonas sp. NW5]|uniref:alpha/beta fold hydrolase n=1 Tax=Pseudomonas sp. NW5 TaxID=2934934 RepID=UPI0020226647|nr:alpha/beta fold hydrolase [Pseudomonas sp. NW5]
MSVQLEEVRFGLPHIELAAHLYGPADGHPVIALHGWLDNAMSFSRLAPRLEGLRIVALDLAGHGHSGHRPAGCSYALWDYVRDVLLVADQLGWQRFSMLGHSLGAIIATMLAGALPERVERLALIDGLLALTCEPEQAPAQLGEALRAELQLGRKCKAIHPTPERAVQARLRGGYPLSYEAAERLASRSLMPEAGGYRWRSDARLTLPSPLRLSPAQARAFVEAVRCPVSLVIAEEGLLQGRAQGWLAQLPFEQHRLPGGHHLHLDDEAGAAAVADCFKAFLASA